MIRYYKSFQHTEAETKLPPFRIRHLQMHFLEWKCTNFAYDFTEVSSSVSNQQNSSLSSDNGLVPTPELMMVSLLTHICVTRPEWVQHDVWCNFCDMSLRSIGSIFRPISAALMPVCLGRGWQMKTDEWQMTLDSWQMRRLQQKTTGDVLTIASGLVWFQVYLAFHNSDVTRVSWCPQSPTTLLLFNSLVRFTAKGNSKLCIIGSLWGEPPVTCRVPSQKFSNAENISMYWRNHYVIIWYLTGKLIYWFDPVPAWPF